MNNLRGDSQHGFWNKLSFLTSLLDFFCLPCQFTWHLRWWSQINQKNWLAGHCQRVCINQLGYLDTWSGFEAAKTAPWPSQGLHHCGKFLEPSDEWAGRGCYCFLMRWHNLNFSVLTLSMSLRYFGNELYNQGPNTVIAFSNPIVTGHQSHLVYHKVVQ